MTINYVIPIRVAGGCHVYYGRLNNGNWFLTSDSYDWYGYELTENLIDCIWEEDLETKRFKGKGIRVIEGDEYDKFHEEMMKWLIDNGHSEFINY